MFGFQKGRAEVNSEMNEFFPETTSSSDPR